jgi:aspartokinase
MRIKVMKFGGTSVATPEARMQSAMRVISGPVSAADVAIGT